MAPERLARLHPHLFHMAEADTWQSIRTRGLLSTSAVLTRFNIVGADRSNIEDQHRPAKIRLEGIGEEPIVIRDQIPMPPKRLAEALGDETCSEAWYALINAKVFFWADESRLHRLLNARQYRHLEHDVLTVDTARLVARYGDAIWLCHMNSGNTFPFPTRRDKHIFKRIGDYPVNKSGNPVKPIVEVTVDNAVLDINEFVVNVRRMRGLDVLMTLL
ncbi:hypothetical protein GCM10007242_04630 [Pigmentiphaga litoralis]|uniref:DUF7002 family protein n=1 Tax=Pigmentiphaga litoralis TaxID=516702 RepID=UPI001677C91F|nr:hypothetical protein [Pigmentiphaga litoralis]GGX02628.1 hypothetical protein GCM10007242_04630 [Pigmentiphaga litoralis]